MDWGAQCARVRVRVRGDDPRAILAAVLEEWVVPLKRVSHRRLVVGSTPHAPDVRQHLALPSQSGSLRSAAARTGSILLQCRAARHEYPLRSTGESFRARPPRDFA